MIMNTKEYKDKVKNFLQDRDSYTKIEIVLAYKIQNLNNQTLTNFSICSNVCKFRHGGVLIVLMVKSILGMSWLNFIMSFG